MGVLGCDSDLEGGDVLIGITFGVLAALRSGAIEVASESSVASVFCVTVEAGCEPVETVRR
jgi:hypothetical protein